MATDSRGCAPGTRLQTDMLSGWLITARGDDPLEFRGAGWRYQSIGGSNPSDPILLATNGREEPAEWSAEGFEPYQRQPGSAAKRAPRNLWFRFKSRRPGAKHPGPAGLFGHTDQEVHPEGKWLATITF